MRRIISAVDWSFVAVLIMLLMWQYPKPADLVADARAALYRARDAAWSLLPDTSVAYASTDVPRCAGLTQSNAGRVFDEMHMNTCSSFTVVRNTSLTPGTGELRLSLVVPTAPGSPISANATHANGSIQQ